MTQYEIYDYMMTKPKKWYTKDSINAQLPGYTPRRVLNLLIRLRKTSMVHRKVVSEKGLNRNGSNCVRRVHYYKVTPKGKKIRDFYDTIDKLEDKE